MSPRSEVVETSAHVYRGHKGSRQLQPGVASSPALLEPGRVPRIARLMALALKFEELLRAKVVADCATLARLGQVSRARISQIMNLLCLAPDIQEAILFLPRTACGHDPIHLHQVQPIATAWNWRKQRSMWQALIPTLALTVVGPVKGESAANVEIPK